MHCHLLIPDLLLPRAAAGVPDPYQGLHLPALETLLGRAHLEAHSCEGEVAWLCRQFGATRQQDWPVASLTLVADGGDPANAYWLRADPVHLHVARDQLILVDPDTFALQQDEAEQLVASLNQHFAVDGLVFEARRPGRWYVRLDRPADLETTPLPQVTGKHIDPYLPRGGDALRWHTLLNEIQMLLFTHPVNEAREAAGELPVNSIWPWGGGRLPENLQCPFQQIWADNLLAQGLALATPAPLAERPADASAWLAQAVTAGAHLIVLDALQGAAQYSDATGWQDGLQQLEQDWFAPLLAALRQKKLQQLTLHAVATGACRQFSATAGDVRKFWRRPRPLAAWALPAAY